MGIHVSLPWLFTLASPPLPKLKINMLCVPRTYYASVSLAVFILEMHTRLDELGQTFVVRLVMHL